MNREHAGSGRAPARVAPGSSAVLNAALLAVWLGIVVFTTTRHEYWRDEVRVLSLARTAASPLDLVHVIRYEAHPVLWYLVIYLGDSILHSPLVLPIASIVTAFAAMAVFMFRAPFPWWLRTLFLFSAFPLYEYSVKVRNYGISMLFLFLAAALYRDRERRWLALAVVLALLANTNAHSVPLALLLMAVWLWDQRGNRHVLMAAGIVGLGIVASLIVVSVPRDTVLSRFYARTPSEFANAVVQSLLYPRPGFRTLFPSFIPWAVDQVILYLAIVGLIRRPVLVLAAVGGLMGLGTLFRVGVPGDYRHAGLFLCYLLTLYWIAADADRRSPAGTRFPRFVQVLGYGALTATILAGVYRSRAVPIDISHAVSSSKALGAFLHSNAELREAILVPEPDYYLESLPYYADNPIYLTREGRFGKNASWSSANAQQLSLGELMAEARRLRIRYRRPVLVVLGHPGLRTGQAGEAAMFYRKRFTWTAAEREELERSFTRVAEFWDAYSDENYSVYAVK
jgi:hypothetical protein